MSKRKKLGYIIIGLLSLFLLIYKPEFKTTFIAGYNPSFYQVDSIIDGDTIQVNMNGVIEKVRLIGVDTPETHDPRKPVQCFGQAASEFTKSLIGDNHVRLEVDPLDTNRDRYDRLLRYVYLPDGRLVNRELIANGYGFAYIGFPFEKSDEFSQLQQDAEDNNLGLWSNCSPEIDSKGYIHSNDE